MFRILYSKKGYKVIQPKGDFHKPMGYVMVVNPKNEVLKFYLSDSRERARDYMMYASLSKWGKLKYWLNYKRGSRRF